VVALDRAFEGVEGDGFIGDLERIDGGGRRDMIVPVEDESFFPAACHLHV
jgi:hypothetical protein